MLEKRSAFTEAGPCGCVMRVWGYMALLADVFWVCETIRNLFCNLPIGNMLHVSDMCLGARVWLYCHLQEAEGIFQNSKEFANKNIK